MEKYIYLPTNVWQVAGVIYTNFDRADLEARHKKVNVEQLYRKILNPDYKLVTSEADLCP